MGSKTTKSAKNTKGNMVSDRLKVCGRHSLKRISELILTSESLPAASMETIETPAAQGFQGDHFRCAFRA
jgi:hypothetical protein